MQTEFKQLSVSSIILEDVTTVEDSVYMRCVHVSWKCGNCVVSNYTSVVG